jgi:DeoR family transcriptional regulator, ulaG and ulaABCDEF operon transcriptional repressor
MLEAERHRLILKVLGERSVVSISDFVEFLNVSEATVRRDIFDLADAGRIRRIRGGAEALTPRHETHLAGVPFALNQEVCAEQKRAIARAAAELVRDGDSILINGGTTTFGMVEFLATRSLDILTNSLPIVTQLLATSRNRVTLPGGTIYPEQNIVLSPYESDAIEHFWGQRLFTGCFGLNKFGLMEADPLIVQAELKLLKRCEEVVVLADSRKLRQRSAMIVTDLSRLSTLITDWGATEEELKPLQNAGVRVIQVHIDAYDSTGSTVSTPVPKHAKNA